MTLLMKVSYFCNILYCIQERSIICIQRISLTNRFLSARHFTQLSKATHDLLDNTWSLMRCSTSYICAMLFLSLQGTGNVINVTDRGGGAGAGGGGGGGGWK